MKRALSSLNSTDLILSESYLGYFSTVSSFISCTMFFMLLAAAERTYLQRYYYSKYLYRLTSSRKARKCAIPHFRLTKVRNIKMWLYIRFKLKVRSTTTTSNLLIRLKYNHFRRMVLRKQWRSLSQTVFCSASFPSRFSRSNFWKSTPMLTTRATVLLMQLQQSHQEVVKCTREGAL